MNKTAIVIASLALPACSTLPSYEQSWQTLNAIDFAQTVHIARAPECFKEGDPITRSFIGSKPQTGEVVAYGALWALTHYWTNRWLEGKVEQTDSKVWRGVWRGWQASTLFLSASAVQGNHKLGLRPLGEGCP